MIPPCLFVEHTNLLSYSGQTQILVTVENRCNAPQSANLNMTISNQGRVVETKVLNIGQLGTGQSGSQRVTLGPAINQVVREGLDRGFLQHCYGNELCPQSLNYIRVGFSSH